jgi:sortase A
VKAGSVIAEPTIDEVLPDTDDGVIVQIARGGPAIPTRRRWSPARIAGRSITVLSVFIVAFLVWEFALSPMGQIRGQRQLLSVFQGLTASGLAASPGYLPARGDPVAYLQIPRLGMTGLVVVEGTTPDLLKEGPGHLPGTVMPGEVGNSVIMGRRETYGAPFRDLPELVPGDTIRLTSPSGVFTYVVKDSAVVVPGQPDVIGPSLSPTLTLATSYRPFLAKGRFAVIADLQGPALQTPTRPTVTVLDSENGLSGDGGALGPILLWSELLLMVCVLGYVAVRKGWNPRLVYLLAAPAAVALLILVFENLDRLLPGTL